MCIRAITVVVYHFSPCSKFSIFMTSWNITFLSISASSSDKLRIITHSYWKESLFFIIWYIHLRGTYVQIGTSLDWCSTLFCYSADVIILTFYFWTCYNSVIRHDEWLYNNLEWMFHSSGLAYTSECTKCKNGTYSEEGASSCKECAVNTYSEKGATECKPCDTDTTYSGKSCLNIFFHILINSVILVSAYFPLMIH